MGIGSGKHMIQAEHLVKRYGSNYALNDISFTIGEGEIVGLLGPNGAGKSTAMNILTGYLAPTSGRALVDGRDISEYPAEVKRMIGFLPEQPPVYPDMTVKEYLDFVYDLKGCTFPREAHLSEVMAVTRTQDVQNRLIGNLSKGYRQRVGIAEALVGDPKIIIFDEPTVGLDPKQILEVRNLMRTLAKKHTVILSTHILAEAQAVCERIIIINRGKIVADAKTDEMTRTIEGGYRLEVKILGPEKEVATALSKISGVGNVEATGERDAGAFRYLIDTKGGADIRRDVFRLCCEKNYPLLGMSAAGTDLESVFIRLVDRADAAAKG